MEAVPVGILLVVCLALMIWAGPVMGYMEDTVRDLADRSVYSGAVLSPDGSSKGQP